MPITPLIAALAFIVVASSDGFAASALRPPPPGAIGDAPDQFTRFSSNELSRGFLSLAFGSDLSIGATTKGIRRFNRDIRARIHVGGTVDRKSAMEKIVLEYAAIVPNLRLRLVTGNEPSDITINLIDEKNFAGAIENAFGRDIARAFVEKTDPQCMTSVHSEPEGPIIHAISFVIVDRGDKVFFDCAYHELLHAFGLSNHDDTNPWTTLNQQRQVGYLTVYDRALLTLLYDPHIEPGLSRSQAPAILSRVIRDLGLAAGSRQRR